MHHPRLPLFNIPISTPLLSEIIIVYPSLYAIRLDLILSNLSARHIGTNYILHSES